MVYYIIIDRMKNTAYSPTDRKTLNLNLLNLKIKDDEC
jgi:hypothetical protein